MRAFRNLSVGLKLTVSSALAVLMLGALVLLVRMEAGRAYSSQFGQEAAARAQLLATEASMHLMRANSAQRGVLLAQSQDADPGERVKTLKEVGDISLYVTGFFAESLSRKLVDADYYIGLGRGAYAELAGRLDAIGKPCQPR